MLLPSNQISFGNNWLALHFVQILLKTGIPLWPNYCTVSLLFSKITEKLHLMRCKITVLLRAYKIIHEKII